MDKGCYFPVSLYFNAVIPKEVYMFNILVSGETILKINLFYWWKLMVSDSLKFSK